MPLEDWYQRPDRLLEFTIYRAAVIRPLDSMTAWADQLHEAERLLAAGNANQAFRTAFGALEACYRQRAEAVLQGRTEHRFAAICDELRKRNRISQMDYDLAMHLSQARNLNAHTYGFEPSLEEAKRCVQHIRRLCGHQGRKVSDVMSKPVLCATPAEPVGRYIALMQEKGISYFPVVDDKRHVVGTLDEWALIEAIQQEQGLLDLDGPVADFMSPEPLPSVAATATLTEAARILRRHKVSALLILHAKVPQGIVTAFDLIHDGGT